MRKSLNFEESTLDGIDLEDYLELMGEESEAEEALDIASPFALVKCKEDGCWRQFCNSGLELADEMYGGMFEDSEE